MQNRKSRSIMDFTNLFDNSIHEKKPIMCSEGGSGATVARGSDIRSTALPGKPGTGPNFSYPRPEGRLSRHEASNSRSSVTSNNSIPEMTDSSDSEVSLDDDYSQYNASASELWDSFWPSTDDGKTRDSLEERSQAVASNKAPARQTQGYFSFDFLKHYTDEADDDTITLSPLEDKAEGTTKETQWPCEPVPSPPRSSLRSSPRRPNSKRSAATYSVYPKPQLLPPPRFPHPPRTSSLNSQQQQPPPPSSPPPQQQHHGWKGSKSTHDLHALSTSPPPSPPTMQHGCQIITTTITATTTKSVPVSPAYPPPPPSRALRPSVSAVSLRDKLFNISNPIFIGSGSSNKSYENVRHNITAPPPPLAPRLVISRPQPDQQQQRFVSVFEFDSDAESISENNNSSSSNNSSNNHNNGSNSFAKRLLMSSRSLHKKSGGGSGSSGGLSEKKRNGSLAAAIDTIAANAIYSSTTNSSTSSSSAPSPTFPNGSGSNGELNAKEKDNEKERGSPSRKRGGSLGRILGLKSR